MEERKYTGKRIFLKELTIHDVEEKRQGYEEKSALERMLRIEVDKLDKLLRRIKRVKKKVIFEGEEIKIEEKGIRKALRVFKDVDEVKKEEIDIVYRDYLIEENVLFYDPLDGMVEPQSRLILKAIRSISYI